MDMNYSVGNVMEIEGVKVIAKMKENTNMLTYWYKGKSYKGITVGVYVGVIRGPYTIVGKVEKEFLEDLRKDSGNQTSELSRYIRKIEIKLVGYFLGCKFEFGIKCYPMIYDEIVLLEDNELKKIFQGVIEGECLMPFGKSSLEGVKIGLDWSTIFNTHLGIFGNTGSGKSNTLTKIYSELFELEKANKIKLKDKSEFLFIDFNGEYASNTTLTENKVVLKLSTNSGNSDKIQLKADQFWNSETLSILFSATDKTQKPFIKNMLKYYLKNGEKNVSKDILIKGICSGFKNVFKYNNHKESLDLLKDIYKIIKINIEDCPLHNFAWAGETKKYCSDLEYADSLNIDEEKEKLKGFLNNNESKIEKLTITERIQVLVRLELIFGLAFNHVQFDHINPLLQRINARSKIIDKIIDIKEEVETHEILVVSLRNCDQEAKKIIPLLLSKQTYELHKKKLGNKDSLDYTFHLIIDEAHNILSEQTNREEESWKDYRLDVFEEIIKEGRKFGYYLTIASQRPYDISPTIISQLHNYFIHRLTNDLDLRMINNTINTLDYMSKNRIPTLVAGECVITGTSFDMPILLKVDKLIDSKAPKSESANLKRIWLVND